jgi:hypothetical protein
MRSTPLHRINGRFASEGIRKRISGRLSSEAIREAMRPEPRDWADDFLDWFSRIDSLLSMLGLIAFGYMCFLAFLEITK